MSCRVSFVPPRTRSELSKLVRDQWKLWRLVLSDGGFDFNTVFHQMTLDEIDEANVALDFYIKQQNKAMNKK